MNSTGQNYSQGFGDDYLRVLECGVTAVREITGEVAEHSVRCEVNEFTGGVLIEASKANCNYFLIVNCYWFL